MKGFRYRRLPFHFVVTDPVVLVGEELLGHHPDLLGIISRGLNIDLVGEFHHGHVLAYLLDRLESRRLRLVEIELLECPEISVVIAVRGAQQIGARIEGQLFLQQSVRQRDADLPGYRVVGQAVCGLREQYARFGNPCIVVLILFIQQRTCQTVQIIPHGTGLIGLRGMQAGPQLFEAGERAYGKRLDARILDRADHGHLQRIQGFGRDRCARIEQVRGAVSRGGTV